MFAADERSTMWCKVCRQDVPALPSPEKRCFCCPRCGGEVCTHGSTGSAESAAASRPNASSRAGAAAADQLPSYDGWELDEQLRHIERVLHAARANQTAEAMSGRETMRFDTAHAVQPDWHMPVATRSFAPQQVAPRTAEDGRRAGAGAGTALCFGLGMISFFAGSAFLGWSWTTGRQELWAVGLPLALGGPLALLVGLALQIHRLWRDYCSATTKLDHVDRQLHELQATTTMLGASQGPLSSVFYSHLTNGAGPQVLLTDLKSQLDLLAMKLAQEKA